MQFTLARNINQLAGGHERAITKKKMSRVFVSKVF